MVLLNRKTVPTYSFITHPSICPDSKLYPAAYWVLLMSGVIIGIYVAGRAEEIFAQKDCPMIVIDEIVGFLISTAFLPKKFWLIVITFAVFRIFDGLKIKPMRIAEKLYAGWGIMADDIIAGVFTNIVMQIVAWRFF